MTKVPINRGPSESSVALYKIFNTSHRSLLVLAANKNAAKEIAYAASHIHYLGFLRKDRCYPDVSEIREPFDCQLADCAAAIRKAIDRRIEGTVHLHDGYVTVGQEVIEP